MARLRSLTRPGFDPKTFLKNTTAAEIACLVALALVIVASFVIYSFAILPDQVRYVQLSSEVETNRTKIEELQKEIQNPDDIRIAFEQVKESLDQFRGEYLKPRSAGRIEIIKSIDEGCRATGTRLASAVTFATSTEDDTGDETRNVRKEEGKQLADVTLFPSIDVQYSITGSYKQLREFLAKFEGHRQFVVIQSVSLASAEDAENGGGGRGRTGDLTLDITAKAFFQPGPQAPQPVETAALKAGGSGQ